MPTPAEHRRIAESFGLDPERYDRTRPRYPAAVVQRIVAALPNAAPTAGTMPPDTALPSAARPDTAPAGAARPDTAPAGAAVLDVGAGTGILARQLRATGCQVIGIDPDARMAAIAGRHGIPVEVATFEQWDPAGRTFDGVVAGQAWHWVDPAAGARQAARVLRPGGLLALLWNTFRPGPEVAAAFSAVYREVAPSLPFDPWAASSSPEDLFHTRAADGIRQAGGFGEPEQWQHGWEQQYSRDEWLDLAPTSGGHHLLPPAELEALLTGMGAAINALGGTVVMPYRTVVTVARREG